MKKIYGILLLTFILVSVGCLDKEDTSLEAIKIVGLDYGTIQKDSEYILKAYKIYGDGQTKEGNVTWASSDASIVKVNSEGKITALELTGDDPIIITAKEEKVVGSKRIYVK
jgi:hypothetical protein